MNVGLCSDRDLSDYLRSIHVLGGSEATYAPGVADAAASSLMLRRLSFHGEPYGLQVLSAPAGWNLNPITSKWLTGHGMPPQDSGLPGWFLGVGTAARRVEQDRTPEERLRGVKAILRMDPDWVLVTIPYERLSEEEQRFAGQLVEIGYYVGLVMQAESLASAKQRLLLPNGMPAHLRRGHGLGIQWLHCAPQLRNGRPVLELDGLMHG